MSILVHPTSYAKNNYQYRTKFIPREESNHFAAELGASTSIRCVDWPRDVRVLPQQYYIAACSLQEVCISDTLMPLTRCNSGSMEPQMISEHREFLSDDTFQVTCEDHEPIIMSGRTVIHAGNNRSFGVNSAAKHGKFYALAYKSPYSCEITEFRVEPWRRKVKCIELSVWDQRVQHMNAYLVLANGLLVG